METVEQPSNIACTSGISSRGILSDAVQVQGRGTTEAEDGFVVVVVLRNTEPEQRPHREQHVAGDLPLETSSKLLQGHLRDHLAVLDDVEATTDEGLSLASNRRHPALGPEAGAGTAQREPHRAGDVLAHKGFPPIHRALRR